MPQLCLRMLALPEGAAPGLPRGDLQAELQAAATGAGPASAEAEAAAAPTLLGPASGGDLDAGQALWAEVSTGIVTYNT